ncbi:MAG: hypothetical protein KDI43_03480 [Gammaproteobacteria bacterium]|nr:hypothetical protein [Gammaproteobacteria bacterium]
MPGANAFATLDKWAEKTNPAQEHGIVTLLMYIIIVGCSTAKLINEGYQGLVLEN